MTNWIKWTMTDEARKIMKGVAVPWLEPTRTHPDDAGFDLRVLRRTVIPAGATVDIAHGIRLQLPSDTWGMLTGRSSAFRKHHLLVVQGVIDPGYRGEMYSLVTNLGSTSKELLPGDRVSQLIILSNRTQSCGMQRVAELGESARGTDGFGSSGR